MRKKIVAGNWKMNLDYEEGLSLFSEVVNMVNDEITGQQHVIVCSPFIHLHSLVALRKSSTQVSVGAQNAHQAESGAFTGEISAKMIRSVGAEYVILGHSERRQYFGESNELLAKKVDITLKHALLPIFCIGKHMPSPTAHDMVNSHGIKSEMRTHTNSQWVRGGGGWVGG